MKSSSEDTIEIIQSAESLLKCLSHRDLKNAKVQLALSELKKSVGFKRIVGELSSVHVLNFGNAEAQDGSQRFRRFGIGECVDDALNEGLAVFDRSYVLQIFKHNTWSDASISDLTRGSEA